MKNEQEILDRLDSQAYLEKMVWEVFLDGQAKRVEKENKVYQWWDHQVQKVNYSPISKAKHLNIEFEVII